MVYQEDDVLLNQRTGIAGLLVALLLAVPLYLLHHTLQEDEQAQAKQRMEQRASLSFSTAQSHLLALQEHLHALRSLVELKPDLNRNEFDQFNSQSRISAYGIAAFEWIPHINRKNAQRWVNTARADGIFDFRLIDDNPEQPLFPIYYSASAQMNGLSLGRNLASHPALWQAMQRAVDNNALQVGVSENTDLDETDGAEFRLLMPVIVDQQLRGYVSAMFRFEEAINILLGSILNSHNGLGLVIADAQSKEQLFSSISQTQLSALHQPLQAEHILTLGDRKFGFRFIDTSTKAPWWILSRSSLMVAGIALVALSMLLLLQRTLTRRARAEALARQQTRSLEAVQSDYHNLFEKVIEGVYSATLDGRFMRVNPALARAFGYNEPNDMLDNIRQIGHQLYQHPVRYQQFLKQLKNDSEVLNFEWEGRDCHGNVVWLSENAYLQHNEQGELIYQGTIDVITERKENEQRLSYQARHDALTGLLNRSAFQQTLDEGLQLYDQGSVLFIDIDGFKKINDTLGHAIGDRFLCELAQRLRQCIRSDDTLARIGGDEFVIYSQSSYSEPRAIKLAERLQAKVCEEFWLDGMNQPLQVSASIGIRFITQGWHKASDILRDADLAMYEVKNNGKGAYQIFSDELHQRMTRQNQLERLLEHAMERHELSLHYQPIVCMQGQQINGFEALLRWRINELGWVSPAQFIPVAEQSSLIQSLGLWVIREGLAGLARIQQRSGQQQLTLNINLSPRQLQDNHLLELLPRLVARYHLRPEQINFELTESALNIDEETIITRLAALREQGFGIYIDDFGTGYSSLKRLVDFPVTGIKIDRSFVDRINEDQNKRVMVEMIMSMSRLLDLKVVAEGIETFAEQQMLHQQGCTRAQGYLFYRPLPEKAVIKALKQGNDDSMVDLNLLPA